MNIRRKIPVIHNSGLIVILILFLITPTFISAVSYPKLKGFVTDNADMISPEWEERIEKLCREIEHNTTAEIAVVTVPSLEGLSKEEYAVELFQRAGIGKKDKDNGVLILLAKKERKYRVEVGYGLEPYITDSMKVDIGMKIMEPAFKRGEFGRGIYEAVAVMGQLIQGKEDVLSKYRMRYKSKSNSTIFSTLFSLAVIFIFFLLFARGNALPMLFFFPPFGGGYYRRGGFGGGYVGGFGGGFGGFGGGSSGGGGFGGGW